MFGSKKVVGCDMPKRYEQDLFSRIGETLYYVWDPIGVCGAASVRDEYDAYVPRVYALLEADATVEQIANHLDKIMTDNMGLGSNLGHNLVTAQRLIEWRATLLRRRPEILG
jgi:hypothetical protein